MAAEEGIDAIGPTKLDLAADARTLPGDAAPRPVVASAELARGATIGRYLVLERLGAGGMGVVYAAYDPELDRKVAVKLLHSGGARDPETGRARLLREAQAMAKLAHPNVVAVHDVGTFGDEVFVAMEFVQGRTLSAWLEEAARGWRAVLGMFLETGRGLSAAHAAGLVHRDFKPDNVLIGADGRPRVTDFGLARVAGDGARSEGRAAPGPGGGDIRLTQAGAVMGTPAFMAPEQHLGLVADARSDQFAFCVALWQGLFGQLPFAGETLPQLALAVTSGELAPTPRGDVPAWLRAALVRGLAVEPGQRWPSIDALLEALARDPSRARRRRLAWLGAVGLVLGTAAGAWRLHARQVAACVDSGEAVAAVWSEPARAAVRDGLLRTGEPYAADAWAGVERRVDAWSEGWRAAQVRACQTRDELSGPRLVCLGDRLRHLRSLVGLLSAADREVAAQAVHAAAALPSIAVCDDPAWLAASVKPPEDAAVRARVEDERERLAQAAARLQGGRYDEGEALAAAALQAAEALGYAPLRAEALLRRGEARERRGDYAAAAGDLEAAYSLAARIDHDEVAARATITLTRVAGKRLAQHAAGLVWSRVASVIVARLGEEDGLLGADLRSDLGLVLEGKGDTAAAIERAREALAIREARLGPNHPDVATSLHNLGMALLIRGSPAEAIEPLSQALAIRRAQLGEEHPEVGASYNWLGNTHLSSGRLDEALALYEQALAIRERALPTDHPDIASTLGNLGLARRGKGDHAGALALQERALAIRGRTLPDDHPDIAASRSNLGETLAALGRHAEAREQFQGALDRWERSLGPDHPALAFALVGIGKCLLAERDAAAAVAPLERAVALRRAGEVKPSYRAAAQLALAEALWLARADERPRARSLAEEARRSSADDPELRAEVEAWLAGHAE